MTSVFVESIHDRATHVVNSAAAKGLRIATVETVTGGLLAAALTEVAGVSKVFERGFILYHNDAKASGLGVDPAIGARHGAVSRQVTAALCTGLRTHSGAHLGIAITGYAGPTGGNADDPVGTVYLCGFGEAAARLEAESYDRERAAAQLGSSDQIAPRIVESRHVFGGDRVAVKLAAVDAALALLQQLIITRRN